MYDRGVENVKVELYSVALCPFYAQFFVNRPNQIFLVVGGDGRIRVEID